MFYSPDQDTVVWASAFAPNTIHELPGFRAFKSISHWVPGTNWITYVRAAGSPASPQLVYLDTETGAVHQVSDELGDKLDRLPFPLRKDRANAEHPNETEDNQGYPVCGKAETCATYGIGYNYQSQQKDAEQQFQTKWSEEGISLPGPKEI